MCHIRKVIMKYRLIHGCWLVRRARLRNLFVVPTLVLLCVVLMYISIAADELSFSTIVPTKPSPPATTSFPLILPHIEPIMSREQSQLYVAVVVNSAASGEYHRLLRMTIRKTWGNSTNNKNSNNSNDRWRLFFALGIGDSVTEHERNLQEALHYNDVIIGNFIDIYDNITVKTFMGHFWVTSKLSSKYVLKTDDDVYVRVPKLLKWLEEAGSPQPFYGGFVTRYGLIVRDPRSKWFISEDKFDELLWPPFCHGAFHVLSTDILPKYFNYAQYIRKPFHTDDAYLGVVARDLAVDAIQIPGFNLEFISKSRSDCELLDSIAMGHLLDVPTMMKYHSYYNTHNSTNPNCARIVIYAPIR